MKYDKLKIGKLVWGDLYFHVSTIGEMPFSIQKIIEDASSFTGKRHCKDFNVCKLGKDQESVSLLMYQAFFEEPFPSLVKSWSVNINSGKVSEKSYRQDGNPPILHRKELLLSKKHQSYQIFSDLSKSLADRGLRPNTSALSYRNQWEMFLEQSGIQIENHRVLGD